MMTMSRWPADASAVGMTDKERRFIRLPLEDLTSLNKKLKNKNKQKKTMSAIRVKFTLTNLFAIVSFSYDELSSG